MKKDFFIITLSFSSLYLAVIIVLSINSSLPIGSCLFFPDGRVHDVVIEDSLALAREEKFERAAALIKPLACNGNLYAQYLLAEYYYDFLDQPEAAERLLFHLADNDYEPALYHVGFLLVHKWGDASIEKLIKVIYLFEGFALNDDGFADTNLTVLYNYRPTIIPEMEEAARDGNAMAGFNMGVIYLRGLRTEEGLIQDLDVAREWFLESASLGFQDSLDVLEGYYTAI